MQAESAESIDPREVIKSLFHVPGLAALEDVCERHNVSLTCHGGCARRIATLAAQKGEFGWDIFDCVPFSSDIDLVHSGPGTATAAILEDIYRLVPFSEQLRWELRSQEEQIPFEVAKVYSGIIPSMLIELDSREGWRDPWDGLGDIRDLQLRFIRNGFYSKSPLHLGGRDVELFAALLYYRTILETPGAEPTLEGIAGAQRVLEDANDSATVIRLQESAYLRSRLRYLLSSLKASAPTKLAASDDSGVFREWGLSHLESVIRDLGGARELLEILFWAPEHGHLSISNRLGGDRYRLPAVSTREWKADEAATHQFESTMARLQRTAAAGDQSAPPLQLEPGQRIILGSNHLTCAPGVSPSGRDNEFVHLCVRTKNVLSVPAADLSSICVVTIADKPVVAFAAPTSCSLPAQEQDSYLSLRCNFGRLLSSRDDGNGRVIEVFVSQLIESGIAAT